MFVVKYKKEVGKKDMKTVRVVQGKIGSKNPTNNHREIFQN